MGGCMSCSTPHPPHALRRQSTAPIELTAPIHQILTTLRTLSSSSTDTAKRQIDHIIDVLSTNGNLYNPTVQMPLSDELQTWLVDEMTTKDTTVSPHLTTRSLDKKYKTSIPTGRSSASISTSDSNAILMQPVPSPTPPIIAHAVLTNSIHTSIHSNSVSVPISSVSGYVLHASSASDLQSTTVEVVDDSSDETLISYGIPKDITDATISLLYTILENEEWNCDLFQIHHLTNGHPLLFVTFALFQRYNFLETFHIPQHKFISFINVIEDKYYNDNPYHNRIHASEVLWSTHYLLVTNGVNTKLTDCEFMCLLLSAICHDVEHTGKSNKYEIKSQSPIATTYNDVSPLEMHHLSVTFRTLREEPYAIFAHMEVELYETIRATIIDLVLATDLKEHFKLVAALNNYCSADTKEMLDTKAWMKMILKMGDISHSAKSTSLHLQWTDRISEEWWRQGDLERNRNMEISAFCNRMDPNTAVSQIGFFDFIVLPLYKAAGTLLNTDCMKHICQRIETNREHWKRQLPKQEPEKKERHIYTSIPHSQSYSNPDRAIKRKNKPMTRDDTNIRAASFSNSNRRGIRRTMNSVPLHKSILVTSPNTDRRSFNSIHALQIQNSPSLYGRSGDIVMLTASLPTTPREFHTPSPNDHTPSNSIVNSPATLTNRVSIGNVVTPTPNAFVFPSTLQIPNARTSRSVSNVDRSSIPASLTTTSTTTTTTTTTNYPQFMKPESGKLSNLSPRHSARPHKRHTRTHSDGHIASHNDAIDVSMLSIDLQPDPFSNRQASPYFSNSNSPFPFVIHDAESPSSTAALHRANSESDQLTALPLAPRITHLHTSSGGPEEWEESVERQARALNRLNSDSTVLTPYGLDRAYSNSGVGVGVGVGVDPDMEFELPSPALNGVTPATPGSIFRMISDTAIIESTHPPASSPTQQCV